MSDFEKIEFLTNMHGDNPLVVAILERYEKALQSANTHHIIACNNEDSPNAIEAEMWTCAQFRMAQMILNDTYDVMQRETFGVLLDIH